MADGPRDRRRTVPMAYQDARTDFVRRAIAGRSWRDHDYIDELRRIEEELAAPRPHGVATTLAVTNLLCRYPRESEAIRRELRRPHASDEDPVPRSPRPEAVPMLSVTERVDRHRREWIALGGLP